MTPLRAYWNFFARLGSHEESKEGLPLRCEDGQ
jgi:hypothetical protein